MPTTLDEIVITFLRVRHDADDPEAAIRDALAAVLRKHIEPIIAEAYRTGFKEADALHCKGAEFEGAIAYGQRIISTLLSPPTEGSKE